MLTSRLPFAGACRTGFLFAGLCVAATFTPTATAHAQRGNGAGVGKAIDSVVTSFLKEGQAAGLSVAVVRGKDTLALKGYGKADLELDVPTPRRAVYEIGSVTKQFTSVALLMLRDEGKLSLDDDFTKYLPDYPTNG
ncbi:MAG: beta-lactamase family protein, partial [Gemmatimonadaceae bacterium]|nr:beta-lactamase family protein [Gemmatimonadaceae bacterium]